MMKNTTNKVEVDYLSRNLQIMKDMTDSFVRHCNAGGAQSPENQLAPKMVVVNVDQEFKK